MHFTSTIITGLAVASTASAAVLPRNSYRTQSVLASIDNVFGCHLSSSVTSSSVASGSIMDFAVEKCVDGDGNQRCSKPFLVKADKCYNIEWTTDGTLSHTTAEVKDAGSGEMVYYRDTNGEWTPEKGELVYLDFKPKVWKTGNDTVDYKVTTCK